MAPNKPHQSLVGSSMRERILAAAERLLATGRPEFTMRDLAAEAGVSFATPFNHFGSKALIMLALSSERITTMHARFTAAPFAGDAVARVLSAIAVAADVMLERPSVNRAVMGAIGAPSETPCEVWTRSSALWAEALGKGDGLMDPAIARVVLPDQLAIAFRGVLSFWTAGEIADQNLAISAHCAAASLLLGFAGSAAREHLMRPMARLAGTRLNAEM